MGEEKFEDVRNIVGQIGSSPRGRGKVGAALRKERLSRITPALAGKRCLDTGWCGCSRDHPRVGGEKFYNWCHLAQYLGSPPHGRGKDHLVPQLHQVVGITPAWAGKRRQLWRLSMSRQDHPRVGGEKKPSALVSSWYRGSPPRRRGKEVFICPFQKFAGITPA